MIEDYQVDGLRFKAFAPFLYNQKNIDDHWGGSLGVRMWRMDYTYRAQLLESIIGGLQPQTPNSDGRSSDHWTPILCF